MPFTSWKLGRVAGIDLFLHPTFLIVPLIGLANAGALGAAVSLLVFGCVLLHELGHALMARRYGIGTADITLYPIGGVARLVRMPRAAGPELLIALAGPAVNVAISAMLWAATAALGPFLVVDGPGLMMLELATILMQINLMLAAFNMLPVFPMDGGRVLRAALTGWLGRGRATEVAAALGRTIAVFAGAWFLLNGWVLQAFLAAFIFMAGSMELRSVRRDERSRSDESDWPAPPPGYRWVTGGDGVYRLAPIVVTWGPYNQPRRPTGPQAPWN